MIRGEDEYSEGVLAYVKAFEPALRSAGVSTTSGAPSAAPSLVEDAVSALVSIGFKEREARRNIDEALRELKTDDLEALVRAAISR